MQTKNKGHSVTCCDEKSTPECLVTASKTDVTVLLFIFLVLMDLFLLKFMIIAMTDFDIVNFPFLEGDVLRRASYGVYVS